MARALHIFLDQHRVVTEAVDRFAFARCQRCVEVLCRVNRAHALAPAAGAGLDQHRITDLQCLGLEQRRILIRRVVTRHQRHAGLFHQSLGLRLESHRLDRRRRWSDKDQSSVGAGLRKGRVLAQESVARMDRLRAAGLGGLQNGFPAQITVFWCAGADVDGLITRQYMFGSRVGVRIHRHRPDAQTARRGRDPAGDFAAIGNQDFVEHKNFLSERERRRTRLRYGV